MSIPKILHQTVRDKHDLSDPIRRNIERLRGLCTGWDYRLYDDVDVREFIQKNCDVKTLSRYDRIDPRYGAARADFFRYLLMHKVGGVYLDIKASLKRPLDDVLSDEDVYLLSHWRNKAGERYQGWGLWPASAGVPENGEYQQWHIVSEPGHPFLAAVIARVSHNIDAYDPAVDGVGKKGVIAVTGPLAYSQAICAIAAQHRHRVVDILGLGFVYSIFETQTVQTAHQFQFKDHYASLQDPIVIPAGS